MDNNFRFERKFVINQNFKDIIIDIILSNPYRFRESYEKRQINNIYLDDINFNSARDNIDGNSIRRKFRLRWYGQKYGLIKPIIEKKYKNGTVGNKSFFEIKNFIFSNKSNKFDIKSQIERNCKDILFLDSMKFLNPELLNSYSRRYFTSYDKNIRITLDTGIENYRINSISHFKIPDYKNKNPMIMEMKYDNNLNVDVSTICQYFPFRQERFSKYIYGLMNVNY